MLYRRIKSLITFSGSWLQHVQRRAFFDSRDRYFLCTDERMKALPHAIFSFSLIVAFVIMSVSLSRTERVMLTLVQCYYEINKNTRAPRIEKYQYSLDPQQVCMCVQDCVCVNMNQVSNQPIGGQNYKNYERLQGMFNFQNLRLTNLPIILGLPILV